MNQILMNLFAITATQAQGVCGAGATNHPVEGMERRVVWCVHSVGSSSLFTLQAPNKAETYTIKFKKNTEHGYGRT